MEIQTIPYKTITYDAKPYLAKLYQNKQFQTKPNQAKPCHTKPCHTIHVVWYGREAHQRVAQVTVSSSSLLHYRLKKTECLLQSIISSYFSKAPLHRRKVDGKQQILKVIICCLFRFSFWKTFVRTFNQATEQNQQVIRKGLILRQGHRHSIC